MKLELPEFKRCCFCLPLRYGLLAGGYVKLVFTLLVSAPVFFTLIMYTMAPVDSKLKVNLFLPDAILTAVIALLLILDICMTVVFLIGGHTKTVKLLNIFYIYSIVALLLLTFLFTISTGLELYYTKRYISQDADSNVAYSFLAHTKIIALITFFGVGFYVILLLRSEINKLRNNQNFRFVNIATEAQCAMENEVNDTGDFKN